MRRVEFRKTAPTWGKSRGIRTVWCDCDDETKDEKYFAMIATIRTRRMTKLEKEDYEMDGAIAYVSMTVDKLGERIEGLEMPGSDGDDALNELCEIVEEALSEE